MKFPVLNCYILYNREISIYEIIMDKFAGQWQSSTAFQPFGQDQVELQDAQLSLNLKYTFRASGMNRHHIIFF